MAVKKVVSIEIGYLVTRICETDYKSKTHKVYRSCTVPTPEGIINDGVLTATEGYVESIRSALAVNRIKSKQVVFTITSARIASREVTIPYVKENRIANVVNANASEYFPVDLSQYQLSYTILGVLGDGNGTKQYKLIVMAAPAALLGGYYDLAKALKLEVEAIDYAGNSIYQVVKEECAQDTSLIIKIDERASLVMAVQNSMLTFSRNVSYGVDEALDTVMHTLCWGEVTSPEQAIRVMQRNDCIALYGQTGHYQTETQSQSGAYQTETQQQPEQQIGQQTELGGISNTPAKSVKDKAKEEVREALMPLVGGIARVIDYYVSRNQNALPTRVLITGLGADFKGMDELLSREINYNVTVLKEAAGWNFNRDFKNECFGEYLACIGAAAQPLGFKKEEKAKEKAKKSGAQVNVALIAYLVLAVGVVASVILIAVSVMPYLKAQKLNAELKAQEKELEAIIPVYNEYVATKAEYTQAEAMYEATQNRNDSLYEFLVELEEKLPKNVAVVSFMSESDTVTINMDVATKEEAAAAIEQLRTFESLIPESVTAAALVKQEDDEGLVEKINFTVQAVYQPMDYVPETEEEEAAK